MTNSCGNAPSQEKQNISEEVKKFSLASSLRELYLRLM